jgi:hypothetical protein
MDQLAAREDRAVWQYPYDRPHCYLLTNLEAYLDLYLATGDSTLPPRGGGRLGALSRQMGEPRRFHLHYRVRRVSTPSPTCCTPSWKSFAGMPFGPF